MTDYYFIFKDELGREFLYVGIDDVEDADAMLEDDYMQLTSYQKIELSKTDYVIGYGFFNDDCDGDEESDLDSHSFNTIEDGDLFFESNNYGGHYEFKRYDVFVNGQLTESIFE
jgi:hypothetical protein